MSDDYRDVSGDPFAIPANRIDPDASNHEKYHDTPQSGCFDCFDALRALVAERDALKAAIRAEYDKRPVDRYPTETALADALFAAGVVKDEREVQAAALEAAADDLSYLVSMEQPDVAEWCTWLRDRAAEVRR